MIKFATDESLGKVVDMKATKVWCFGVDPIKSMHDLRFAAGGNKFSQLCGFKFKSTNPSQSNPLFTVAFVAKIQSSHYRKGGWGNPSQWYVFKQISKTQTDVLDKQACLINYGFDVDKFFESDLFNLMLPKLKAAIQKGVSEIPNFVKTLTNAIDIRDAEKFSKAISDSLENLNKKQVNNKYYQLKVESKKSQVDTELDEKIEQELKRKGIYADLDANVKI